jgi:hypothetical protein
MKKKTKEVLVRSLLHQFGLIDSEPVHMILVPAYPITILSG